MLDILSQFWDFYIRHKEHRKCERFISEMGQIEEDIFVASKSVQRYLDSCKANLITLLAMEMLTISNGCGLNIANESSETEVKDHAPTEQTQETYMVKCSKLF